MGDAGQVLSLQHDISPRKPPATWPRRPSVLRTINLPLPHPSHWLPPSHLHPGALCLSLSTSLPSFLHPGGGKVPRPSRRGKSAPHHGNTQRQESPAIEQSIGAQIAGSVAQVPTSAPPLKLDQLIHLACVLLYTSLCNPMDCSPPGSSVHGISQQDYWSSLPLPPPSDLPDPEIEPTSPAPASRLFTASATWEPPIHLAVPQFLCLQNGFEIKTAS